MTGFIYAIESGGRIKIGYSTQPQLRMTKLATDAPFPCNMLGYWPGTLEDEQRIHERFSDLRSHGEWFDAGSRLSDFINEQPLVQDPSGSRFVVREDDTPLAAWRKSRRMTQGDLASKIGIATSHVSFLENRKSSASLAVALRIRELAGTDFPIESLICEGGAA